MLTRAPFISPTSFVFVLELLVACALGQTVFWAVSVMAYGPHALAAALGLLVQIVLQRNLARRISGERRWRVHLGYAGAGWALSMLGYLMGGTAFFVQASVAITLMPLAGILCGLLRGPQRPVHEGGW